MSSSHIVGQYIDTVRREIGEADTILKKHDRYFSARWLIGCQEIRANRMGIFHKIENFSQSITSSLKTLGHDRHSQWWSQYQIQELRASQNPHRWKTVTDCLAQEETEY